VAALARAQDVVDAAHLELGDGLGADHAAVRHDAHAHDAEALTQPIDHRQQGLHVGGVAGPGLRADRSARFIEHHADDDLLQIGAMVLRLAALAQRLAASAMEVERGGVEEYDREVAEQAASVREEPLLDHVLGPPLGARGAALIGELLNEASHGAIEVMQLQARGAVDAIGIEPYLAGPVRSRDHEPVQHGGEHLPLHRKLEVARTDELLDEGAAAGLLPQPAEHHGGADAPCAERVEGSLAQAGDEERRLAQARARAQQRVELARRLQRLDAAERRDHALAGLGAVARVLDDLEIAAIARGLDAEEHAALQ